jgi:fatty acid desaturase
VRSLSDAEPSALRAIPHVSLSPRFGWTPAAPVRHEQRPEDTRVTAGSPEATARRNDADARRYLRQTLAHTVALYLVLAAALADAIPAWILVAAVPWLYVRLSLGLHELLHVRAADQVPAFHRMAMIFDTPFGLGYREHRAIHFRHHRFAGDERDPELWQIEGGRLRAFASAMTTPERSLVEWVRARGVDPPLLADASVRLIVFLAIAALNPPVFLVYWLVLRVSIGTSGFVFHHLLHNRRGALGTYALPFPERLVRAGRALLGAEPMLILARHRSHHVWPDVRVRDLPQFPTEFALPPGPLAHVTVAAAARCALPASAR